MPLVSPIKVIPPTGLYLLPRARLCRALDDAFRPASVQAIFVGAPGGRGKTTLACDYARQFSGPTIWLRLDEADADPGSLFAHLSAAVARSGITSAETLPGLSREHLYNVRAHARVWLRALRARIERQALIVIDDLHLVAAASDIAGVIALLVEEAAPLCRTLLLSRSRLPSVFARSALSGSLIELDPSQLDFTVDEVEALLRERRVPVGLASQIRARTGGWAWATAACVAQASAYERTQERDANVRGFIEAEVLSDLALAERQALRVLAPLPYVRLEWLSELNIDRSHIDRLTTAGVVESYGMAGAGETFRLHPFIAEWIQGDGASLGEDHRHNLLRCARLLAQDGAQETAVRLWLRACAWQEAARGIIALAPALLAGARHATLKELIGGIPETIRSAALWFCLAEAELLVDPVRGRTCAIAAYERARATGMNELAIRALALIISSYLIDFSSTEPIADWLEALRGAGASARALDDPDLEATVAVSVFSGLMLRDPGHAELRLWESRVRAAITQPGEPTIRMRGAMFLAKHYWYTGQYQKIPPLKPLAALHLNHPALTPYGRLVWFLFLQYDCYASADSAAAQRLVEEALAYADHCGIHLLDNFLRLHASCHAVLSSDESSAARLLAAVAQNSGAARRMEMWHHFLCRSSFVASQGNAEEAVEHALTAVEAARAMGPAPTCMALIALAHAKLGRGDPDAQDTLAMLRAASAGLHSPHAHFHIALLEALLADARRDLSARETALRQAFAIAKRSRLIFTVGAPRHALRWLAERGHEGSIEREFVEQFARLHRFDRMPCRRSIYFPSAPLRAITLGRFALERNGAPVALARRSPRRQIELLQALIALGGMSAAQLTLADALWPDAEGDAALHALETTVYRLRRTLGAEAIAVDSGRIHLNTELWWVDSLACQALATELEGRLASGSEIERILVERLIDLYTGDFLPEVDAPWALAARHGLRARIAALGARLAEFYRRCDAADLAESISRWLSERFPPEARARPELRPGSLPTLA
jgi:LuxR family maltose regulon positive regulatory protein